MPSIKRSAEAVWNGGGPDGKGTLTTKSGTLSGTPYSAGMRFGEDKGTNPEELIAAAHAGCFNMALAFGLGGGGHKPDELRTDRGRHHREGRRRLDGQVERADSEGQGARHVGRRFQEGG